LKQSGFLIALGLLFLLSPAVHAANWYVNDTATVGDSFCSAIGYNLEGKLTSGDTVYIDAGFYYENDTYTIDTNMIWLIGKDSVSTVIRFDQTGGDAARAIYAKNKTNLVLRDFSVTNGRYGIWFENVDISSIARVRTDTNGLFGIYLMAGCETNTLTSNTLSGNGNSGMYLNGSSSNTLTSNTSSGNTGYGVWFEVSSNNNTLTSNRASGNGNSGIYLNSSSNNNTLTSNRASGNGNSGIFLSGSSNNTLTSNVSSGNATNGIYIIGSSDNNQLTLNSSSANTNIGILLNGSSNNTLTSNTSSGNASYGIYLTGSSNNTLTSNTVDSNGSWGFYLAGASAADTFRKNVYIGSPTRPDSGVWNQTTAGFAFDFTRNWWGTTDSAAIRAKIWGSTAAHRDSIVYTPFRLGIVDTAAGADTVAPRAPDTVAVLSTTATTV
jgi:parallel beta-helix repeat protein